MSANIIRPARFDLDYKNKLLKTSNDIATASKVVQPGEAKIQGATSIDGKFFLTQSGQNLTTFRWKIGQKQIAIFFREHRGI